MLMILCIDNIRQSAGYNVHTWPDRIITWNLNTTHFVELSDFTVLLFRIGHQQKQQIVLKLLDVTPKRNLKTRRPMTQS